MTRWFPSADVAHQLIITLVVIVAVTAGGCRPKGHGITIQNKGSDTMVNVAQAWAELYRLVEPGVSVEVSGGGSGTGVAALIPSQYATPFVIDTLTAEGDGAVVVAVSNATN